jgi:N-acetyl-alpha-D-glucosaminyl L-malate synthase BshA
VTAVSESLRRATIEQLGIQNHIDVVPNFIDPERYEVARSSPGARRWAKPDERLLVHISNFRPVKRVLDCIYAFAKVRAHVDAELIMAGDGPDRGPAEDLARDLGVADHVRFLGKQDHMERLIPRMHALHLPSETEAFGLAALEAMACGVPPVATLSGGVPDLITNEVDGYMEPVGNTDAQARRLTAILTDEVLHDRLATAARATAQKRFCTDLIIPRYEAYYERVCAAGARIPGTSADLPVST